MQLRIAISAVVLMVQSTIIAASPTPATSDAELARGFSQNIHPFLETYCIGCHGKEKAKADLDLSAYTTMDRVVQDEARWKLVLEKLFAADMPPENAKRQPTADERKAIVTWIQTMRQYEMVAHAGDPGIVLAHRLSNAEYDYTIRDLTGVDIRPTKEFPVDPANQAGFDNSGESLAMSPALMNKYLQAAREVANHMVLRINGIAFAPYPMLVDTDRDKFCVQRIIDFYHQQDIDYADYFQAAWRFKHRSALGKRKATLADFAAEDGVSSKYLGTIWHLLETKETIGPVTKLQTMWRALPAPKGNQPDLARAGCEQMRNFVVQLRAKTEMRFPNLGVPGMRASAQPFLMWKNRQYATHRLEFDHAALQVQGETQPVEEDSASEAGSRDEFGPGATPLIHNRPGDPDLFVPAGQRARYEAAFAKFCAVFPDTFYVSERGRNYFDKTKDQGRFLSAGFHNLMGYFRDDQPLYELLLDEKQQKELDTLWQELDFIASGNIRTFVQFYFNESGEARGGRRESEGPRPADKEVTSEAMIQKVEQAYLAKALPSSNAVATQAIKDHFDSVNEGIRWVERARIEAEPVQLKAVQDFAERAYRRPLAQSERDDLAAYYQSLRKDTGLDHEEALRDLVVYILMSPDFCYRMNLSDDRAMAARHPGSLQRAVLEKGVLVPSGAQPLSDYALASRLSYFIWSSMPDEELLSHAAAGDLHRPEILVAQARRMLKDPRARGLATEFGGHWLDFRLFEQINTVDRDRFPSFNGDLREAMFEEPIRFFLDVAQEDRSVLDFVYAKDTFVNPVLAKHYGIPGIQSGSNDWVHVTDASAYGRGGLLPMSAFLTQNAPGLRTSPVKRGYWVVRRVLGEVIPPPPAVVPELPHDEAKMDLPLRQMLAKHREDPTCAACHSRFDSFGLVFEGYGPVGERRSTDLAGRPVDDRAEFPGSAQETGVTGLREYIHAHRENDFVDNLCRKMLVYALGRTLMLSDESTIEKMHARLAGNNYRFSALVETIVTSPQFLTKRAANTTVAQN